MKSSHKIGGCFPVGKHYPGIAEELALLMQEEKQTGLADFVSSKTPWKDLDLAVIDVETTGLDPKEDRILELGIVWFKDGQIRKRYTRLINPRVPIPEEARTIHGINEQDLRDAPTFPELLSELEQSLTHSIPAAYNAAFDRNFLHAELDRVALNYRTQTSIPSYQPEIEWIDPLPWSRELLKELRSKKLVDVCAHFGVSLEKAHRAVHDAEATGTVLFKLAPELPQSYGELIRIQKRLIAEQQAARSHWQR